MNKEDRDKEKFKQDLISTIKVISGDYKIEEKTKSNNTDSKKYNFFELGDLNIKDLNNKEDYIKLRAETDSVALKRKFSNKKIYQKNLPKNNSCKSLYDFSEKIRYELLGAKMLNGISKNLKNNYTNKIFHKKKDQLKSKDDVQIIEAFELYMLKNFLGIKLNSVSEKMLSYWEKDFNSSLNKHIEYLNNNLENQETYNSKFSEILQNMEIFESENNQEKEEETEENNDQDKNNQNNSDSNENYNSDEGNENDNLREGV